ARGQGQPRTDLFGDPLPPQALARMGTVRFRHPESIWEIAYSPDGKWLATASGDRTVVVWDAATGKRLLTLRGHGNAAYAVAFAPDGKTLVWGSKEIHVWDATSGKELRRFGGDKGPYYSVNLAADGRLLATAGYASGVRLWDPATGKEVGRLGDP